MRQGSTMAAMALAPTRAQVDPFSIPEASAFSWPPEAGYWHARKPAGGFALLPVDQLLLPWHAYQHGLIEPLTLRGYLASREMPERRCELEPGTRGHYRARELQELLGPAVRRRQATAVIEALAASGLVAWTEPAIRLIAQPTDLQGLDPSAYAAMRAHVHPLLYRVPVPRRMLRYLAREGSPGLIATTLGVVLQCVRYYRKNKQCRSGGTLSAAWLADCFGLTERTAYRGLATLDALGWLATVPPPPEIRCPDGPWRVVNMGWDVPQETPRRERAATRRRPPVQLELFPLAGIAASDARPSGSAQAPGGNTPAPEDAAASAPPAGAANSPEPPAGDEAPTASTPDAAAVRALIEGSLLEAAAHRASHTGAPEDRPVEARPEDQAATCAPAEAVRHASQAAAIVEAREARADTAALEAEAPAAPPAGAAAEDPEARYAALPAADQEALWAQARAHLMQQGTPPAFLITPVVLAEVCRRLAQHGGPDAPEAVPHAAEAAPAGADGCKNLAVDNRHDGKNLAVPLKELDPEPFPEIQDPEPTERGPTGAWHGQKSTENKATLRDVQPEDLWDLERLLALHHQAAMRGWITWSEADRLNVVATAVHARRVGHEPCRLFVALLRDRRWEVITQEDEDTAHRWLREQAYGPRRPAMPAAGTAGTGVPLSDEAHFAHLAQQVLRAHGWRDDPFLLVHRQYPEWTRARWEQAQAELEQWRLLQAQANARSQLASLGVVLDREVPWEDAGDAEEARQAPPPQYSPSVSPPASSSRT